MPRQNEPAMPTNKSKKKKKTQPPRPLILTLDGIQSVKTVHEDAKFIFPNTPRYYSQRPCQLEVCCVILMRST